MYLNIRSFIVNEIQFQKSKKIIYEVFINNFRFSIILAYVKKKKNANKSEKNTCKYEITVLEKFVYEKNDQNF